MVYGVWCVVYGYSVVGVVTRGMHICSVLCYGYIDTSGAVGLWDIMLSLISVLANLSNFMIIMFLSHLHFGISVTLGSAHA